MTKKMGSAFRIYQRDGLLRLIVLIFRKLTGLKGEIAGAKERVLDHVMSIHKGVVAYGPFTGMILSADVWWGKYDVTTKLLGVYERHILDLLVDIGTKVNGPFVDIGAADGYYAIGALKSKMFDQVFAFEISEPARKCLAENAALNNVSEMITISGEANYESLKDLISRYQAGLILIDIEGSEYSLLDKKTLRLFENCHLIVELHPWLVEDGDRKQDELLASANEYFDVTLTRSASISPNAFPELLSFNDDERLLAFSEGRGKSMEWMILSPN